MLRYIKHYNLIVIIVASVLCMGNAQKINTQQKLSEATDLLKKREYIKSIEVCDSIIRENPDYVDSYLVKGYALSAINKNKEAIDAYDMAIKYNPQYEDAKYNKAVALSHIGKHKEAGELYMELWDDESLDEYKKALERAEHIDLNGQHVVIIPKKESKQTKSRSIGNKKTTKEKGSKHTTSP